MPTIYPWVQAVIWAFKPTEIIDIRRFPRDEALAAGALCLLRKPFSTDALLAAVLGALGDAERGPSAHAVPPN